MQPLVIITRTQRIESIHEGVLCVADHQNRLIYGLGDPETAVFFRSAAKPIQAMVLAHSGALERFRITSEELAVICSSHSGEDFHRQAVQSILRKIGLTEEHLLCGCAAPYNKDINDELIKTGAHPSPLHNCCSGKHAGMLALCRHHEYPVEDYHRPEHPVQLLIRKTLAGLLGCEWDAVTIGTDGCGVPTFLLTIRQAAYLYSLLAQGSAGQTSYSKAFGHIQAAMRSHPRMVNGDREFCTDLITHSAGTAIGKIGAEGIYCVALPEKQLGICLKIADGRERGLFPSVIHLLSQLDALPEDALHKLTDWAHPPVKNHLGKTVGAIIPIFDLHDNNSRTPIRTGDRWDG